MYAALIELGIKDVSGFDLSALNAYCWHPHHEKVELGTLRHRVLSAPFPVHLLDLQGRVDSITGQQGGATAQGRPNSEDSKERSCGASGIWEHDTVLDVPVTAGGHWNAVAFWFEARIDSTTMVSSYCHGSPPGSLPAASSWEQAVQYLDGTSVAPGSTVQLRVRQDLGQLVFTTHPQQQCRPRHALVPRWHFDMVLDSQRNKAYDGAIRRAIQRKRDEGCQEVMVLDVGAGTGLLSMMAARSGGVQPVSRLPLPQQ